MLLFYPIVCATPAFTPELSYDTKSMLKRLAVRKLEGSSGLQGGSDKHAPAYQHAGCAHAGLLYAVRPYPIYFITLFFPINLFT
jgi:hypothetical protein